MFRRCHNHILSLLMAALLWCSAVGAQTLSPQAELFLLSCSPGEELYARYGHTALEVRDPQWGLDVVFNYGIFSFDTDFFYWKFVRGETWYQLGVEDKCYFDREYAYAGREIAVQRLELTQEEKQQLWLLLLHNYEPENRFYLYNFVFDNCATRPYNLIKQVLGDSIRSDYKGYEGQSYRRFIRHYTRPYSWADFGINLLFGPKADCPMEDEQRLFLPEELMLWMASARRADGAPVVQNIRTQAFAVKPVAWYADYRFGLAVFFVIMTLLSFWDRHRGHRTRWVDGVLISMYVLLLLLVAFLTFFSLHPLVGFGWRLGIIPLIHLCARFFYIFS